MKKFPAPDNYLDLDHLQECKAIQEQKLICFMEKKASDLCKCISIGTYAEELIFRDAFYKGYIAAFCVSKEEEALELSLSPLGKALD